MRACDVGKRCPTTEALLSRAALTRRRLQRPGESACFARRPLRWREAGGEARGGTGDAPGAHLLVIVQADEDGDDPVPAQARCDHTQRVLVDELLHHLALVLQERGALVVPPFVALLHRRHRLLVRLGLGPRQVIMAQAFHGSASSARARRAVSSCPLTLHY